ncbi:MAG TPA: hypothetical protein VGE28_13830 [Pseudomonas sp.]
MLDKGAVNGPFGFTRNALECAPARLVQGLLCTMHKHEVRVRQSAP